MSPPRKARSLISICSRARRRSFGLGCLRYLHGTIAQNLTSVINLTFLVAQHESAIKAAIEVRLMHGRPPGMFEDPDRC